MSASWVGASNRAAALARRRVGAAGARALAGAGGLPAAVELLSRTPYGHAVRPGQGLETAQHGVAATLLWHLRVLSGWCPRGGGELLRALAAGFEIASLEERLRWIAGREAGPGFHLGSLATLGAGLPEPDSTERLRTRLAASAWGDPGGESAADVRRGLRLRWAARVAVAAPAARPWAAGAAALLVAREVSSGRELPAAQARMARRLLGRGPATAGTVPELVATLPREARWVLAEVADGSGLWRAEGGWWHRVEADGAGLLRRGGTGPDRVLGAVTVLAADAWRVRAALEVATAGSSAGPLWEAFDAVA